MATVVLADAEGDSMLIALTVTKPVAGTLFGAR
jgi:hypothetical protein